MQQCSRSQAVETLCKHKGCERETQRIHKVFRLVHIGSMALSGQRILGQQQQQTVQYHTCQVQAQETNLRQ